MATLHIEISGICSTTSRDAFFPDFSGIHDFHKSKLSVKTYDYNKKLEGFSKLLLFQ